jgi:YD repeat-containing protein
MVRHDGRAYHFVKHGGVWITDGDVIDRLTQVTDPVTLAVTGWTYTYGNEEYVETYDTSGRLLSLVSRAGSAHDLVYDASGNLASVTDRQSGRTLLFGYDASGRLIQMTDPSGQVYDYAYDANNRLTAVTYPDTTTKGYLYENAMYLTALTGIVDENGSRFATFQYDAQGRGISSAHGAGADLYSLTYSADGSATVINPLGTSRAYAYQEIFSVNKATRVDQPAGSGTLAATHSSWVYDAFGNITSRTDYNSTVYTYTYDTARNLEISRTEAFETPQARTIATTWHPSYRLPTQITEPNRVTTQSYDAAGNLLQSTVTSGALSRSWQYSVQRLRTGHPGGRPPHRCQRQYQARL